MNKKLKKTTEKFHRLLHIDTINYLSKVKQLYSETETYEVIKEYLNIAEMFHYQLNKLLYGWKD